MSRSATVEQSTNSGQASFQLVASLLDALDRPLLVADRRGRVLFTNLHAQEALKTQGSSSPEVNLFADVLNTDPNGILGQLEGGEQEVNLLVESASGRSRARVRWLPEPDWLVVYLEPSPSDTPADEAEMRQTVQDLMQEREITYRNLLAAYLRLQEVNRQKTVFLASAAHELKTPLAVMKGYYDLLLSGSLGKLSRAPAGDLAGIQRKLRSPGPARFDVSELFRARERQARSAAYVRTIFGIASRT